MAQAVKAIDRASFEELQNLLVHDRELERARIKDAFEDETRERETIPGDEADFAEFVRSANFVTGVSERHNVRLTSALDSHWHPSSGRHPCF